MKRKISKPTQWIGQLPGSHLGSNSTVDMESWEKKAMTRKNQEFRKTREKAFRLEEEHGTEERWPSGKRKGHSWLRVGPQAKTLLYTDSAYSSGKRIANQMNVTSLSFNHHSMVFFVEILILREKNNFIYQIFIEYITIGF